MTDHGAMRDLGGTWELREAIGETWRWYAASGHQTAMNNSVDAAQAAASSPGWSPVAVPGSVIDALAAEGSIPDPRRGWGSRCAEWTGVRHWLLRRDVDLDDTWLDVDVTLEIDGMDPGGRVMWNGVEIARVDGLYRAVSVAVPVIESGRQQLVIVLDPAPREVPQVGRTEDVRRHAPRVNQGWDFCPPFPHQGLWREVRLRKGPHMVRLGVQATLAPSGDGHVRAEIVAAAPDGTPVSVRIGSQYARGVVESGGACLEVTLAQVKKWWPAGMGDQPVYDVVVTLLADVRHRRVGFRTAVMEATPGATKGAYPYGLRVNGEPVPLVGLNWTPVDAQFGAISRVNVEHLLDLARAAGARLIRVWGGGLVETEEFYDLCDERGLLVWQEFSQSSSGMQSAPAADPAYVAGLAQDARELVRARIHHPALVLWGGGNELQGASGPLRTEQSAALMALAEVVAAEDPARSWLPTSPTGPEFANRLDVIRANPDHQHDVHGPWEYQGLDEHHTLANESTAIAHTEFGVEGMANRRLHEHLVPEELREPAGRSGALYRHLGEWWNNEAQVQQLFGGGLRLATLRRASQWLQASGLATSVEADRRRWPRTSMVIPWQLNESYPNAWGTALVGFDGEPKPAFWAVARAFADERATLRTQRAAWGGREGDAEAWLWSLPGRRAGGALVLTASDLWGVECGRNEATLNEVTHPTATLRLRVPPRRGAVIWRAVWLDSDGTTVDDERVVQVADANLRALTDLPKTELVVNSSQRGWTVTNAGEVAAIAWGPRDRRDPSDKRRMAISHDPRPLMPGETAEIEAIGSVPGPRDFAIDAWNAAAVALPASRKER